MTGEKKGGFFQDADGNMSSGRLMSFICLMAGIGVAIGGVLLQRDTTALVGVFIGAAMGGKAVQSFAERL